ncbi:MAG: hypothetical protein HRT58_20810 [Crocinitomicaceae bacterium]|nr:hypothetical protein [Flavobacteriales bacterium]NQZ38114.1 hypothetical protein [Crocinitomicaceae bacterium]
MKYIFFLIIGLFSLQNSSKQIPFSKTTLLLEESSIEIKLSFDEDNDTSLFNLNSTNRIHVTVYNNSDSTIYLYENWNSYGFYNFTFEIETEDSIYTLHRPKKLWYRNFPSFHTIPSLDSFTFDFMLLNTEMANKTVNQGRWIGFPIKEFELATIKVKYELNKEHSILPIRIINPENYLQYLDASILDTARITYGDTTVKYNYQNMFSETLVSERKSIHFQKE